MIAELLPWVTAWLATYLFHSTLLLLGAWLLTRLAALRAPRPAEMVWRTALFGGVLTASLHVFLGAPLWRTPLVERTAVQPVPVAAEVPRVAVEPRPLVAGAAGPTAAPVAPPPAPVAPSQPPAPDPAWLLLLWPLGALVLLGRSRSSHRRLATTLRDRRDATDGALRDLARRLTAEAGVRRPMRLTLSGSLASPIALGIRRLEICLPERATATLAPHHLEAMLAHEVAHLARHDPLWLHAYRTVAAVLFFQPLNHLAVARLRDASERLCDAWAATSRQRRVALAECLTIVADWIVEGTQPLAALAMARKSSKLGDRVHALLEPDAPASAPGRARVGLLALAPLALVLALAPGLKATAAPVIPRPTLEVSDDAQDPVAALDAELGLLAGEVAELGALLEATDRPELARRIQIHLETLEARRDALFAALAAEGR